MAVKPTPIRRKDGTTRYRVQFREHPGTTPTSESFDTLDHAQRFIEMGEQFGWAEARKIRDGMTTNTSRLPTLAAWFETHLEELSSSVTPGTIHGYRNEAARTWLPRLGHLPIDMISREMVIKWVGWQRQQETHRSAKRRAAAIAAGQSPPPAELVRPKTIANAQRTLSSVMEAATKRYPIVNPAKGVRIPDDAEPAEMVFLSRDEYTALYQATDSYWRPLVAFLGGTGARWGEATALRPGDFDFDAATPSVRISRAWKRGPKSKPYIGSPKSRRGIRTVTLSTSTVAAIRDLVEATAPDQFVFRSVRGGRVHHANFYPRAWNPAVAASGIGKSPGVHDLRHSHASWLIAEGVPLPIIQRRLGHESIQTTVDQYGHLSPEAGMVAAAAIERALGGFDPDAVETGELLPPEP